MPTALFPSEDESRKIGVSGFSSNMKVKEYVVPKSPLVVQLGRDVGTGNAKAVPLASFSKSANHVVTPHVLGGGQRHRSNRDRNASSQNRGYQSEQICID